MGEQAKKVYVILNTTEYSTTIAQCYTDPRTAIHMLNVFNEKARKGQTYKIHIERLNERVTV
jgi:hypothetical protein